MQAQGLPFSKIKRESGRRNGEERVDTKLLPRKASVNVSHVPQHGSGDDRSDQERQRVLQSGVDNVFHFSSSKQKPRTILTNFFLALSRPFGPELCHSSANAMVSDSATFSFVRDHTTSGLRARPAKRLALLRPMQGAASAARIEATTPSMLPSSLLIRSGVGPNYPAQSANERIACGEHAHLLDSQRGERYHAAFIHSLRREAAMQLFLRGDPALARPSGPAAAMPANVSRTAPASEAVLLALASVRGETGSTEGFLRPDAFLSG
jgi:hypothetical protein